MVLRQTLLFLSHSKDLEEFLHHNQNARSIAQQFFAGETRPEALCVAKQLQEKGIETTLNYLCEELISEQEAAFATEEYASSIEEAAELGLTTSLSVKLTNLGIRVSEELAKENLWIVASRAAKVNRFVRVDMEGPELTDKTLKLVMDLHGKLHNVGAVLQACQKRSDGDLHTLNHRGISVRLVKGSYIDRSQPVEHNPEEVALYYMRLIEGVMHSGMDPCIATHDEKLIEFAIDLADIFEKEKSKFEFQMLYGIGNQLQDRLVRDGYRVRIYLPYGKGWYPFFMRRLAERPSLLWKLMKG